MEMPTYTSIFTLRRKLYAIYDWELPRPVELVQVGVFLLGVAAVFVVTTSVGTGLSASNAWMFVVPPAAVAWYATQPVADEKSLGAWVGSQLRYLCEPRRITAAVVTRPPDAEPVDDELVGAEMVGSERVDAEPPGAETVDGEMFGVETVDAELFGVETVDGEPVASEGVNEPAC